MASPIRPVPPYQLLKGRNVASDFPNLVASEVDWTSLADPHYNCIAWVVGDTRRKWWPWEVEDYQQYDYWPDEIQHPSRLEAFLAYFVGQEHYAECADGTLEAGFEKLAMYTDEVGEPTHMARQVTADIWWSKVSINEDIQHALRALEGPRYGAVTRFLRRPVAERQQTG